MVFILCEIWAFSFVFYSVTPIADYYILAGIVYQAPDLCSVINSRMVKYTIIKLMIWLWFLNCIYKIDLYGISLHLIAVSITQLWISFYRRYFVNLGCDDDDDNYVNSDNDCDEWFIDGIEDQMISSVEQYRNFVIHCVQPTQLIKHACEMCNFIQ